MDIMEMIESLKEGNFTGYVRIDFNRGIFSKVEKFEEIMKKK